MNPLIANSTPTPSKALRSFIFYLLLVPQRNIITSGARLFNRSVFHIINLL